MEQLTNTSGITRLNSRVCLDDDVYYARLYKTFLSHIMVPKINIRKGKFLGGGCFLKFFLPLKQPKEMGP